MARVNYKGMAIRELFNAFMKEHPEYSVGEALYSILRLEGGPDLTIKQLRDIPDSKMYDLIYNANKIEKE